MFAVLPEIWYIKLRNTMHVSHLFLRSHTVSCVNSRVLYCFITMLCFIWWIRLEIIIKSKSHNKLVSAYLYDLYWTEGKISSKQLTLSGDNLQNYFKLQPVYHLRIISSYIFSYIHKYS